jgi:mRNA interferase HigB
MGTIGILVLFMRIIAVHTIREYWERYPKTEQALKAWVQEIEQSNWESPQSLKLKYRNASILSGKRVVFNINGNKFRLIVDIEYRLKIVFVVWFGTHSEYDLIDSKNVKYVKTNKDK